MRDALLFPDLHHTGLVRKYRLLKNVFSASLLTLSRFARCPAYVRQSRLTSFLISRRPMMC